MFNILNCCMIVNSFPYFLVIFRKLDNLEQSVASDIRLILSLLRQQNSRSCDSVTLPESREVIYYVFTFI